MFDADGDGVPEPLYYNGFKAGSDIVGPQPDAGRDGCGHMSYAPQARRREHGGQRGSRDARSWSTSRSITAATTNM